jgi:surfactin synthase thioesterase subunit
LRRTAPSGGARVTLYCLPFAGGGAGVFRDWAAGLPPGTEVCPIHLPGREARFREPAIDDVDVLLAGLLEALAPHLDRPFALFGHSMGGLIAFELADRLRARGIVPAWFFASGARPPHVPRPDPTRHLLPDDDLVALVGRMNGTPREVIEESEVIRLMLPTIRSDFRLVETYRYRPRAPLPCPVIAIAGRDDPEAPPAAMEAWRVHAAGRFEMHVLPGDHFFVSSERARVLELLSERLAEPLA